MYFGLETVPDEDDFLAVPLPLVQANSGKVDHPDLDGDAVTSQSGAWTGINGSMVETEEPPQDSEFKTTSSDPAEDGAEYPIGLRPPRRSLPTIPRRGRRGSRLPTPRRILACDRWQ